MQMMMRKKEVISVFLRSVNMKVNKQKNSAKKGGENGWQISKERLNHQSTRKSALTISLEVNITVYIHRGYIMSAHVYIEFVK